LRKFWWLHRDPFGESLWAKTRWKVYRAKGWVVVQVQAFPITRKVKSKAAMNEKN
jgi:hypothetical protein